MNLPLFIARRIYSDQGDKRKVSRPAIRIATVGVAIGLMVMIVTVCVVLGFKHTIRDKVAGFGGHIQVQNLMRYNEIDPYTICADDSMMQVFGQQQGVRHVQRYTITQGLLKTDDDSILQKAIREVYAGRKYMSAAVKGLLQSDPPIPHLSNRQSEVLQALGHGYTNRDIALQLGISSRSVEVHVNTLLAKIGAANRTEAVSIALRKHLLKI